MVVTWQTKELTTHEHFVSVFLLKRQQQDRKLHLYGMSLKTTTSALHIVADIKRLSMLWSVVQKA